MDLQDIKVETRLTLGISNFINDFLKSIDEIQTDDDIVHNWHVSSEVATNMFSIVNEILLGEEDSDSPYGSSDEEDDDIIDEEDGEESESSEDEDIGCDSIEMFVNN